MKLGFKSLVLALAVTLLCVPAAMAKNGNGHGKPSWAGGGGNGHGKPAWAGVGKGQGHAKQHAQHEKVKPDKAKHRRAGADDAATDEEINLDDLNPAWYCFTLEAMMDAADTEAVEGGAEAGEFSSFDAKFGTNDNKRNSHGQCVSRRAQGEELSDALDDQEQNCESADESGEDAAGDDATGEETGSDDSEATDETGDESGAGADEGTTDEPAADDGSDEGSDEQADEAGDCQGDGSAEEEGQDEAADDSATDEDETGDDGETAAFARALVRFLNL
jgi:hypothetical protein